MPTNIFLKKHIITECRVQKEQQAVIWEGNRHTIHKRGEPEKEASELQGNRQGIQHPKIHPKMAKFQGRINELVGSVHRWNQSIPLRTVLVLCGYWSGIDPVYKIAIRYCCLRQHRNNS
jgi:hypothetical protein